MVSRVPRGTTDSPEVHFPMSADIYSSWSYAEALSEEDEVLLRARERGYELGVSPSAPGRLPC